MDIKNNYNNKNNDSPPPASAKAQAAGCARAGGGSGSGRTPSTGFSTPTAGKSPSAPLYIINVKKKISSMNNPYGFFTDMSEKDQRFHYKDAVTTAKLLKKLDINVANSKLIIEILTYLTVAYFWYCYLCIPVDGYGTIGDNTKTSLSRKTTLIDVNFTKYKHLLK